MVWPGAQSGPRLNETGKNMARNLAHLIRHGPADDPRYRPLRAHAEHVTRTVPCTE